MGDLRPRDTPGALMAAGAVTTLITTVTVVEQAAEGFVNQLTPTPSRVSPHKVWSLLL